MVHIVDVNRGPMAASGPYVPAYARCVTAERWEDEIHECVAYSHLRANYGSDLAFQGARLA